MPAPPIDSWQADSLRDRLHEKYGLTHLRVRKHGKVLTLESGPDGDAWPHARFRRDTVHLWLLEMPGRGGRWERTPFRDLLDNLVELVVTQFSWTIAPVFDENPRETSDRKN
ncbi:MAG: hypothetical protein KC766_13710 [Myxococcales bacterium]|nr:hypothetical protein [Myxococcales bacterium]